MKRFHVPGMLFAVAALLVVTGAAAAPAPVHPQLKVRTLAGKTFDLAAQRGKWVIVNFWATWCSPCIEEMPAISKYVAAHPHVTAIGVAWDASPRADIVKFARRHPVDYPLAQVRPDDPPAGLEPPRALPTTYLVAPDGHVAKRFLGPVDARMLDAVIAAGRSAPAGRGR